MVLWVKSTCHAGLKGQNTRLKWIIVAHFQDPSTLLYNGRQREEYPHPEADSPAILNYSAQQKQKKSASEMWTIP